MSIKQEQNSYRCDITRSTQLNSLYSLYSLSSLSWHILTHDTWYLKTLFKPSLFKSSCFKHLNIPWLMKHGLNPLHHWIKHVMINETWFKPSLLTKRFPLGTEWDLHDFLGPLPSFPCITWLPKTFSFRYRMGHSWLPWHPCWDDIHAEMTFMLRWHPCWDDIHAEMTSMLRWHPCWDEIHV